MAVKKIQDSSYIKQNTGKMKKVIFCAIIILITAIQTNADKFIVESFEKAPNDLAARRYERLDVNDYPCALIKVKTDLKGLIFETNMGITGNVERKTGEYWVYVSPGEKRIRVSKEGFVPKDFFIPDEIRIESHNVYILTLTSEQKYPITVNRQPEDALLIVDGENYGDQQMVKNMSVGKHVLKIKKQGYRSIEDTVHVNENNLKFDYIMEEVQPVEVEINTVPKDATILLNDNERGNTNQEMFIFPGEYHLKLTKYLYETINDTIEVKKGEPNIFSYNLNKSSGMLAIKTIPSRASIYIDNQPVEQTVYELPAGKHRIRVEKTHYQTISRLIEIKQNKRIKRTFTLKPTTGKLYLNTIPDYAQIQLLRNGKQVYSFTGDKVLNDIQTGIYQLKANAKYHEPGSKMIRVKRNETTEASLELVRKHRSKESAILWSLFIPGAGQFYSIKQNTRGGIYLATGIGSAAASLYYMKKVNTLQKDYDNIKDSYQNSQDLDNIELYREKMMDKYDELHQKEQIRNYTLIALGSVYVINLLDAIIFGGGEVPINNPSASRKYRDFNAGVMPVRNGVAVGVQINIH
ncbi:MAG: PEGA domain-containing protein [Candidatus Cloacimonetes bacterium]|nr:PEGA domain-containing protein [Candidatus Cloacimonadota bacterium]